MARCVGGSITIEVSARPPNGINIALAARFGIEGEWRKPSPQRGDTGDRPPLSSLGPVHWSPPPAPSWEAVSLQGERVRSGELAGKPALLLFYLGSECGHCVDQILAFRKEAARFAEVGIGIHAVTLETPVDAARLLLIPEFQGYLPFQILCDPGMSAFRAFRAFDDFENLPLHAAVLLDPEGRILWIDVSWEPFLDTAFLLEESQRLLKIWAPASSP